LLQIYWALNKYTIAEKNLGETRVNLDDILNNLMVSRDQKDPYMLNETVTNRITDFDKLLSDITTIPKECRIQSMQKIDHWIMEDYLLY